RGMGTESRPPWPLDDPVGRLLWIARSEAEVWLPTPQEQDAVAKAWSVQTREANAQKMAGVQRG
ncbi:MAG: hypothetical protein M3P01_03450, partial [Actinomycetota bacterium]|nr:hypothetical protein [Actinomycetota bacterium]